MADDEDGERGRVRPRRRLRSRVQRRTVAPAMDLSVIGFVALLGAVGVLRGVELAISQRHRRSLHERGAHEPQDSYFIWMVLLHAAILIGAALEVVVLGRPLVGWLAAIMAAIFLLANIVRWWVIRTLGAHWNVRVVNS